ncbi:MAG: hypothetical protein HY313_09660, partial [Acidobacteria bacterium]|nr:hypothetical protein [Acidobacteriota bacterium]
MAQLRQVVSFVLRSVWFVTWILLSFSLPLIQRAQAQDVPRVQVFGGYSILRPNLPADIFDLGADAEAGEKIGEFVLGNVLGWGSSVTVNINANFGITADFSGHYK